MAAPERFAESQIPLAPRAPSARDPKLTSIGHFQYLTRYSANAQNSHLTFSDMSLPLKGFARIIKFAQDQICQGG